MSERTYRLLTYSIVAVCVFILGVSIGNFATRRVLQLNQRQMLSSVPAGFCSVDGKVWWKARPDGMCYAADEPREP